MKWICSIIGKMEMMQFDNSKCSSTCVGVNSEVNAMVT